MSSSSSSGKQQRNTKSSYWNWNLLACWTASCMAWQKWLFHKINKMPCFVELCKIIFVTFIHVCGWFSFLSSSSSLLFSAVPHLCKIYCSYVCVLLSFIRRPTSRLCVSIINSWTKFDLKIRVPWKRVYKEIPAQKTSAKNIYSHMREFSFCGMQKMLEKRLRQSSSSEQCQTTTVCPFIFWRGGSMFIAACCLLVCVCVASRSSSTNKYIHGLDVKYKLCIRNFRPHTCSFCDLFCS